MNKLWKRPATAAEVAATSSDAESFGRNLRDWQHYLRRISNRQAFALSIKEAPPLLRDKLGDHGQCDAYLAAYVEWLCQRHAVPAPGWVSETARTADRSWYDYPPLWQDAFIHAPGAFRRRGVFTRPDDVLAFHPGRPKTSAAQKRKKSAERQRRYRQRIQEKLKRLEQFEKDLASEN